MAVDSQATVTDRLLVEIFWQRFSPELAECDVARTTDEISTVVTKKLRKVRIESSMTKWFSVDDSAGVSTMTLRHGCSLITIK